MIDIGAHLLERALEFTVAAVDDRKRLQKEELLEMQMRGSDTYRAEDSQPLVL